MILALERYFKSFLTCYSFRTYSNSKRDDNGDTYKYFGEPVYEYSLKDGINDGF